MDWNAKELSLIDAGISVLHPPPDADTQVLNLHGNNIECISNVAYLSSLRELDLSSNKILRIDGLQGLSSLELLNLSSNIITKVEGLSSLRSLVQINLSYNRIEDLSGFKEMWGVQYALLQIDLQGNNILSSQHIGSCLRGCTNLKRLTLNLDGSSNPVCQLLEYTDLVLTEVPQLWILDKLYRYGQPLGSVDSISTNYDVMRMKNQKEPKSAGFVTPRIDEALKKYQQLHSRSETSIAPSASTDLQESSTQREESIQVYDHEAATSEPLVSERRACAAEDQANRCVSKTKNSKQTSKNVKKQQRKIAATPRIKEAEPVHGQDVRFANSDLSRGTVSNSRAAGRVSRSYNAFKVTCTDEDYRNIIEDTYTHFVEELDQERERRWKAEQALKELTNFLKDSQEKAREKGTKQEKCFQENHHLKQCIKAEKEMVARLEEQLKSVKEECEEIQRQFREAKLAVESQKKAISVVEEIASKQESRQLQLLIEERKKVQQTQQRASASKHEVEILQNSITSLTTQVHQLQTLLASRELEHKEELKGHYKLGSKELQEAIDQEMKRVELQHLEKMKIQDEKLKIMRKHFSELEKEFNLALQMESGQLKELQEAFGKSSQENAENRHSLLLAQVKDERTTETLAQLTNVVKKQKEQIAEMVNSRHEILSKYKKQIMAFESQLDDAKKKSAQMELLKQEKCKLLAKVEAQESLIEGLRAERRLWEEELAQQGTSLAQDRGRLEIKIETLTTETEYLKKQLRAEVDAVKIKTKMIDDQTDTISKLKEDLCHKNDELRKAREEGLENQKHLEDELLQEKEAYQDSQMVIERMQERKEELKHRLVELDKEVRESRTAHNILKQRWKEKSDQINILEKQVTQTKESWERKEKQLIEEREVAQTEAHHVAEKLRRIDNAFRKQLEEKERGHQETVENLLREKQLEVGQANQKIFEMEDEMREILRGSSDMREKMMKLANFVGTLTGDLSKGTGSH